MANKNLTNAKKAKNDEFYTQLSDIEKELKHYKKHFKDKVVYCNCDSEDSNFFKYFASNFNLLGLKKLIATSYKQNQKSTKIVINELKDYNNDGAINIGDVKYLLKNDKNTKITMEGDGDFRSDECVKLLKEADIVVTNPPFSLFREFIAQLMEYNKKFLVIGSMNAITYKDVFKLIKNNKLWLGVSYPKNFKQPDGSLKKFGNINWYTNLQHNKRNQKLNLTEDFDIEKYPMYDNYNAIEVARTNNIPKNYNGAMGVPISFLNKYNPNQFEILGADFDIHNGDLGYLKVKDWKGKVDRGYINGKRIYSRIIIRHK